LIGAIVGSQFGSGDGRRAAGILGAVGGAIAGREIERNYAKRTHYELVVRLDSGAARTRRFDARPPFQVGDRVRLANGNWQRESSVVPY
jgi:outer membrane lipoprotein SlyB